MPASFTTRLTHSPQRGFASLSHPDLFRPETWTSATSATCCPPISPATPIAISSPASADGLSPCALPDGLTIAPSGPARAPANLSARQAEATGLLTSGTYGRRSSTSLTPDVLQLSWVSRLRARTDLLGSTLFTMTWKVRATPSGRLIAALRASGRRTSDSGYGLWPVTRANDGVTEMHQAFTNASERGTDLVTVAGWATPQANDGEKRGQPAMIPGAQTCLPVQVIGEALEQWGMNARPLNEQVRLTPWATPAQRDYRHANAKSYQERTGTTKGEQLNNQVVHHGPTPNGPSAATEKPGQLNPAFSLYLMGYPTAWARCAGLVTPSFRRSRPKSSAS